MAKKMRGIRTFRSSVFFLFFIFAKVANIIDYNSDPSPGDKRTDVQWLLGLQLSF